MKPHSTKHTVKTPKANWDVLIKGITALVAVGSLAFGGYQYYANAQRAEIERAKQGQMELEKKQVDLCLAAIQVASEFAKESKRDKAEEKSQRLWGLFGQLKVVESETVKKEIKKFTGALNGWEKVNAPPADFLRPDQFIVAEGTTFEQLADELSDAMRNSLRSLNSNQATTQDIQRRLRRAPPNQFTIPRQNETLMLGMRFVGQRDID